jgi:SAM-dependent methyltransferase
MSEAFYSHARLYDLMFPGGGPAVDFYRADADRQGGRVLELGCGTGHKLIPIASDGRPCVGLDFSSDMLAEAERKANERGVAVEWVHGDMRAFDLGRTFDFVFITANSLLHLHEAEDLVSCFRSVRRHLAPGARFVFDVFNPSVRLLAGADGVRRTRESLSFTDPDRGNVSVDVFGDWSGRPFARGYAASTLYLRVRVIEGERQSRSRKFALANDTHPASSTGTSAARVAPTE